MTPLVSYQPPNFALVQVRVSWQANSLFPGEPHPSIVGDDTVRPTPLIPMEAALRAKQSCTSQDLDVHSDGGEEEGGSAAAYCNYGGYHGSESGLSSLNDSGAYAVAESSHASHPGIADLQEQLAAPAMPCQDARNNTRSESGCSQASGVQPSPPAVPASPVSQEATAMQTNSAAQASLPAAAGNGEQTKQLVAEGKALPMRCVASQPDLRRATATVAADGAGVVGAAELRSRSSAAPKCSLAGPARAATAAPTIRQSKLVLVPARQEKPGATTANVRRTSAYGAAPTMACDRTNYRRSCSKPAAVRHLQAAERAGAACHQVCPLGTQSAQQQQVKAVPALPAAAAPAPVANFAGTTPPVPAPQPTPGKRTLGQPTVAANALVLAAAPHVSSPAKPSLQDSTDKAANLLQLHDAMWFGCAR